MSQCAHKGSLHVLATGVGNVSSLSFNEVEGHIFNLWLCRDD